MSIQFTFKPQKAVQAAAFLLKLHGKPMRYLLLLKMLYIADRISLQRIEQPITGDNYTSMKYGPVLSNVYDLIKGKLAEDASSIWSEFISERDGYEVSLLKDPGTDELCEEEEGILTDVYNELGHRNPFVVAEWTHLFPEWQDPHGSAIPILVEDILQHVGKSPEEIEEIQGLAAREAYLDKVLNG